MKEFKELEGYSSERFWEILAEREKRIAEASNEPVRTSYPANELAKRLHPERQYMIISKVTEMDSDTKCFRFVPDNERGTTECAVFPAGRYLSVFVTIDGKKFNRAYSISSSPRAAVKDGYYELTIRRANGGLVSNYVLDNWKVGDKVELSGPAGFFEYHRVRDAKTVIALAGGSGITPFLSMARAIAEGDADFNLTVLYGSKTLAGTLYKDELEELSAKDSRIKVINILSDEELEGYEHGFIKADLIRKYAPEDEPYSVFVSGPQAMYSFVDKEIEKLNLKKKYVRHELLGELHGTTLFGDYPGSANETIKIKVSIRDKQWVVEGSVNDTILQTLEKNGIEAPSRCRSGECGFCHSKLISGDVYIPAQVDGRRGADKKFNSIHPCITFPLTDVEVVVPAAK